MHYHFDMRALGRWKVWPYCSTCVWPIEALKHGRIAALKYARIAILNPTRGQVDGVHYHFVTHGEMRRGIKVSPHSPSFLFSPQYRLGSRVDH